MYNLCINLLYREIVGYLVVMIIRSNSEIGNLKYGLFKLIMIKISH